MAVQDFHHLLLGLVLIGSASAARFLDVEAVGLAKLIWEGLLSGGVRLRFRSFIPVVALLIGQHPPVRSYVK